MTKSKLLWATGLAAALMIGGTIQWTLAQGKVYKVAIAQPNVEHPYRVGGIERAKKWIADRKDIQLEILDGRRNSAVQLSGLEDVIAKGVDIIILSPNDSAALAPIGAVAQKAKVPLVVFDRKLGVPEDQFAAFVGGDNVEMGRVAARFIAEKIGRKGKIIQMEGTPGASATIDRKSGFEEEIKKYPDIRVVSYVGHYRIHDAATAMEDGIVAHPDVVAVYAHNDSMALGASQVASERGKKSLVIVGMDGGGEACKGIAEGKMTASVYYPTMFPEALELAMKVLKGEKVQKVNLLPTPMMTAENSKQYCN